MRADLLARAAELAAREEPYVLAVVTWRRPPSSAQVGDAAIVTGGGVFHGWLGGACTRPTVEREARAALADGRPRLLALDAEPGDRQRPGVESRPMTCHSGGSVEIYLDPVLPAPRLLVWGDSPAAGALAALAGTLGYAVTQPAEAVEAAEHGPEAEPRRRPLYAVVATMGEDDEASLRAALALSPDYVGLVASPRRFAEVRRTLEARGVAGEALDAVRSPAGLPIGAKTPEEIALAVLAEIVQARRSVGEAVVHDAVAAEAADMAAAGTAAPGEEPAAATAVDPVCGMIVDIAGARHTAEHAGRTFHFCCGGCRERFLADPDRHLAAAEAAG
jgi:xanthine dehydrogenase accessory factor